MYVRPILLTVAASLALAGCNRAKDDTATATSSSAALGPDTIATASLAPPGAGGAANAPLPLTAQAFVDAAASSDLYEMGAAKLADSETHPSAVRQFAQRMMRDHAASSNALKAAVGQSETPAQIDNQKMGPEHQAMIDALRAAKPGEFPAIYARQQVTAHERTLAVLENYAKSGDSKALMAFAAKTAPIVRAHLEAARKLPQ